MASCKHYVRRCRLVAPCCGRSYPCRFCHNEAEDHEISREKVNEMECIQCNKRQEIRERCSNCSIQFGLYCCLKCKLFDDTDKRQFHCDKCGFCRTGGSENYFHCDVCDICLSKSIQDSHACRVESGKDKCPVCFDAVHSSTAPSFVPKCGHLIHLECFQMIKQFGHHGCPLCSRPYDIVERRPIRNVDQGANDGWEQIIDS